MKTLSLAEVYRFWCKVQIGLPDSCWPWLANANSRGYGNMQVQEKTERAPRISWTLHNGLIPPSSIVCHSCDNPRCVNPAHLFLGTHLTNSIDKFCKGRACIGVKNGRAVLTETQVREIKTMDRRGMGVRKIAKLYGVNPTTISRIDRGINWAHLSDDATVAKIKQEVVGG